MATRCSFSARSDPKGSLLLGDDLGGLSDGGRSALSVDHDLEALEVVQVGAGLSLGELDCEGGLGPLSGETSLLGGFEEGASAGATSDIDLHSCERDSFQR